MIENNPELNKVLQPLYSRLRRQVFTQELSRKSLVFIFGNDKIKKTYTFSLPAGWSCPGALTCLSKADRFKGGVTDGPQAQFRCFAASEECRLTEVRMIRWHNFELLKAALQVSISETTNLILSALPQDAKTVRVHVSGDFFSESYFLAWLEVARLRPDIHFYGYTKSIPTLLKYRDQMPTNFRFVASLGSRFDNLILTNNLKHSIVIKSDAEADALGLEIDHDDSHAMYGEKSFALVIHAAQPKGSDWAIAWESLRRAKENANKAKGPKRSRPETTTAQWIKRILKMVVRLIAAGGRLTQEDAVLVNGLTFNAGVVLPSPVMA